MNSDQQGATFIRLTLDNRFPLGRYHLSSSEADPKCSNYLCGFMIDC
jgi:hypothetical protein